MVRWLVGCGIGGLVLVGAGIGLLPQWAPLVLASKGVDATSIRWCGEGLCLAGLTRGEDTVAQATLTWDRDLLIQDAVVGRPSGGGDGDGESSLSRLRSVTVENLQVRDLPLPPLSGQVYPERHLRGEGVTVEGSVVTAEVETPVGPAFIEVQPAEQGGYDVALSCAPCTFAHPALADDPLVISAAKLTGTYNSPDFSARLTVGEVQVTMEGTYQDGVIDARFALPRTPIASIYDVFASLVPELRQARIGGFLSGVGSVHWPELSLDFAPEVQGFEVSGLVSTSYAYGPFRFRAKNAAGDDVILLAGEGTPGWMPLAEMGALLPMAVVAAEDGAFWSHRGYDLANMQEAAAENREAGGIKRGGSTMTQQLAKNLFLSGQRTYARKLRELLYTVEMERELGKNRILELYLNVIEWGPDIRGAATASQTYFLKSPSGLLPEEAAWLAGIIYDPKDSYRQQYLANRPNLKRLAQVLGNMRDLPDVAREAALQRGVIFVPP